MNIRSCNDCGNYKYLPDGSRCRDCLPDPLYSPNSDALVLGGIGMGKTVSMKQQIIRTLQSREEQVFIVDLLSAYEDILSDFDATRINPHQSRGMNVFDTPDFVTQRELIETLIEERNNVPVKSLMKHRLDKYISGQRPNTPSEIISRMKKSAGNGNKHKRLDRELRKNLQTFKDTVFDRQRTIEFDTDTQLNIVELSRNNHDSPITSYLFSVFNCIYQELINTGEDAHIVFDHSAPLINSKFLPLLSKYIGRSNNVSVSFVTSKAEFTSKVGSKEFIRSFDTKICFGSSAYSNQFYNYANIGKSNQMFIENKRMGECIIDKGSGWKRGSIILESNEKRMIN